MFTLAKSDRLLHRHSSPDWQLAQRWAQDIQSSAERIFNRAPELAPDLIETLYTVLALAEQVAVTLVSLNQAQTEVYQQSIQQHLQATSARLQDTHDQLQQLSDRVLLDALQASEVKDALPQHLQLLVADNKTTLTTSMHDLRQLKIGD